MTTQIHESHDTNNNNKKSEQHFFRFHLPHSHLSPVFGSDWFALKAEAFARFFGTPVFLIAQTIVVAVWILINALGLVTFEPPREPRRLIGLSHAAIACSSGLA